SLGYLHRFPVDALKIDRTLVAGLWNRSGRSSIIESIIAVARTLGADVIAEGVETEDQMDALIRLGCTKAQGHFFSNPIAARVAAECLAECAAPWIAGSTGEDDRSVTCPVIS